MDPVVAEFVFVKDTRNTHRMEEEGSNHINTLYLQKATWPEQPKRVKVTIEVIE